MSTLDLASAELDSVQGFAGLEPVCWTFFALAYSASYGKMSIARPEKNLTSKFVLFSRLTLNVFPLRRAIGT